MNSAPRNRVAHAIATWFGCGLAPKAPGTAGSAAALLIAIALHAWLGLGAAEFALMAALLFAPAVWSAGVVAADLGVTDPHRVVVDEVIGQWIALAGVAVFDWKSYLAAFALFRLFDIWKPPPVRQLESLPGGWGINADDAMAGVYAAALVWAISQLSILT